MPADKAAERPVQQPADIGRKLLRLRPRQQHAVVQGVQEPLLADPLLFVDEDAVHDGDLPRRPAKTLRRDAKPNEKGVAEGNGIGHAGWCRRTWAGG